MPANASPSAPTDAPGAAARALAAGFLALGRLPLPVLRGAGALLGLFVFALSPGYRRKVLANLARAGWRDRRMAWRAATGAGRTVLELPWLWSRPPAALASHMYCDDLSVLDSAEAEGRGILFLSPHLGAFDATARWYAARAPITVMFRDPPMALIRPLVRRSRNIDGMRAVPAATRGVRAMLRALRAGEAVGILPDQVPGEGEGEWAPFFGEPAWTMTLPQRLAQASGAVVVFAVGERAAGGWRLHLWRHDDVPTPAALNERMEGLIRRWPEQYLWGYNRYKRPRREAVAGHDGNGR